MRLRREALILLCASALPALECIRAQQPTMAQASDARIWVGRYQEIEEYLRTAECVSMERFADMRQGRCVLRPGGPVARMAWMPLPPGIYRGFFTSYKTQIAAYELDRLLKMDMVPPTVERQLQGVTGAATLWVEKVVGTGKGEAQPNETSRIAWDKQVARMMMFDALIGNRERNDANVLRDGAGNLILLDHTRAFGLTTELSFQLIQIDGDLWNRLLGLNRKDLDARLGPWLDEHQITAILNRRESMRAAIDRLIVERGAASVVLR